MGANGTFTLELEQVQDVEFRVRFDFCIVTGSIRLDIPVGVRVTDGARRQVFTSNQAASAP